MMRFFTGTVWGVGVILCATVSVAVAQEPAGKNCAERPEVRWLAHQSLVALLNPMGAEHNLRLGLCIPLYEDESVFFDQNHFEFGVSHYLSPVYMMGGGYVQIAPTSFLSLRAELHGVGIWPIPISGAGYFSVPGYDAEWGQTALAGRDGETAAGWNAVIQGTLRGQTRVGPVTLLGFNSFWASFTEVGSEPHYVNIQHDLITAQSDWVLANEFAFLMTTQVPEGPTLGFGLFDSLRYNPSVSYLNHQIGPAIYASIQRLVPELVGFGVLIRLGFYTDHRMRQNGLSIFGAFGADWDLGGI